jgi:hypothetical protein
MRRHLNDVDYSVDIPPGRRHARHLKDRTKKEVLDLFAGRLAQSDRASAVRPRELVERKEQREVQ